jgi:sulfatase modifying factor 1
MGNVIALNQPDELPHPDMVWIPGGTFLMGSDKHYPEEAPAHEVSVDGYWMDPHAVTNEEFRRFVDATKYVTSAERAPNPEDYPGAKPELLVPAPLFFRNPNNESISTTAINGGLTFRAPIGGTRRGQRAL